MSKPKLTVLEVWEKKVEGKKQTSNIYEIEKDENLL
jgi:hypothetical protein